MVRFNTIEASFTGEQHLNYIIEIDKRCYWVGVRRFSSRESVAKHSNDLLIDWPWNFVPFGYNHFQSFCICHVLSKVQFTTVIFIVQSLTAKNKYTLFII